MAETESPLVRITNAVKYAAAFLSLLWRQFNRDGCRDSAAALTYTTLFAIVPMMTVMFAILSAIPTLRQRGDAIREWAFENFAPGAGEQVIIYLQEFSRQATNLTAIGVVFLFITSILMLRKIETTMNTIWQVSKPRQGVTSWLMYWAVISLGPILLGAGLGVSSYLTSVSLFSSAVDYLGGMRLWLSLLPLFFSTAMLSLLYIVVPNCHVPVRQGVAGAFVAAIFFELAKAGFALFVRTSPSYQVVYGAFAAVPVFLLWIYISWMLVLGGAELVRALTVFSEHRKQIPRMQSLMRLLFIFWQRQQSGDLLKPGQIRSVLRDVEATHWEEFRNLLMDIGMIRRTEDGSFVLARDLASLTLAELVQMLPWSVRRSLRLAENPVEDWERELEQRVTQARGALDEALDVTLEDLFRQQGQSQVAGNV